jgi:hypothetical protein
MLMLFDDGRKMTMKTAGLKAALLGATLLTAATTQGAHAALIYNFTPTDLGFTGGNPAQEVFKETITTDGSTITGKDSFTWTWKASTGTPGQFVAATGIFTVLAFTTSELKLQAHQQLNFPRRCAAHGPRAGCRPGCHGTHYHRRQCFHACRHEQFSGVPRGGHLRLLRQQLRRWR